MPDDAMTSDRLSELAPPCTGAECMVIARPALDRLARIAALGLGARAAEIRLTLQNGCKMTGTAGEPDRDASVSLPICGGDGHRLGEIAIETAANGLRATDRVDDLLTEIGAMALHELRLCQMVRTDALTGAATRAAFLETLRTLGERASDRQRAPLSLLMIDVDHFKQVNDRHGHLAGDRVLGAIAARIRTQLRRTDLFARVGGEEFCIALPETGARSAWYVASRVRARIAAEPIELSDRPVHVTVSVGIATATGSMPEDTMAAADRALYRAKGAGRNRVWPAQSLSADVAGAWKTSIQGA